MKTPLIGMTLSELKEVTAKGKMPSFVATQITKWLYDKKVTSFDEMINISKKNREWLAEGYCIGREVPCSHRRSADGTVKYLFSAGNGNTVESVYIPDHDRATLCVSSQVGCKMNCYFCATGRQGFKANLTSAQIMNQILSIPPAPVPGAAAMTPLTNIVFMGMGEPLDNLDEVLKVIEILTAPWGMAWSPKRITVSTVGKLPQLKDLLDRTQVHVAVSVHTADPRQRESMMPAQKPFPIQSVMRLLEGYDFSHQRRLSLEYIMWRGINDDIAHADMLVKLIGKNDCRVNLIRYHAIPGIDLHPCSEERMLMFRNRLNEKGVTATIRASRGEDIMAACGMLANTRGDK
ncbi:MAG: 23S rRNA (adenine(2503)-C(2))-methyltransferase RlmN [Muribaculaceae bacterium]|nr:23S rRNA (adenine(2503)-C(2))-methyltransferase RlmN [Muribaculaceae bacterium]MDE7189123.1 23S rRNA (adenine(2503)-C(2))-methyltransferase RlmN [Muribaculaceae bacterium]